MKTFPRQERKPEKSRGTQRMGLREGSCRNWPALGQTLTDAVRALPLLSLAAHAASASGA
jgi:hypothetical protein